MPLLNQPLIIRTAFFALLLVLGGRSVPAQDQPSRGRISLPSKTWGLALDLPGYVVKSNEVRSDGRKYFLAENRTAGVVLSIFLEESPPTSRNRTCRQNLAVRKKQSAPYPRKDVRIWESEEITYLEYIIPEFQGAPLQQKNLFACLIHDDVFIDFHFSKVQFKPGEEQLFMAVLQTIKFEEGIRRTSMDYFLSGSAYYRNRNYKSAIGPYQKSLDLEKQDPKLEQSLWRVLVDNLGMAYGITGDLDNAQAVFEYGLTKDSTYPLFYYNLACTWAERNDMEKAMTYLEKAFSYKANVIPGEQMPDPRKDDSFQRFMKNDKFREFVVSLMKK